MGKAITLVHGKGVEYLLLVFEDSAGLWLHKEHAHHMAYIETAISGNQGDTGYPAFTAIVTGIFDEVLGIVPEKSYIKHEDITA